MALGLEPRNRSPCPPSMASIKCKSKLPEYGAEIISDLPEGIGKALQIGGYKVRPGRPRKTR